MPMTSESTIPPTFAMVGGVSLLRLPPGFGPAWRVNPKRLAEGAAFANIPTAAERSAVVLWAARDAGQKPGGSLEGPAPPG